MLSASNVALLGCLRLWLRVWACVRRVALRLPRQSVFGRQFARPCLSRSPSLLTCYLLCRFVRSSGRRCATSKSTCASRYAPPFFGPLRLCRPARLLCRLVSVACLDCFAWGLPSALSLDALCGSRPPAACSGDARISSRVGPCRPSHPSIQFPCSPARPVSSQIDRAAAMKRKAGKQHFEICTQVRLLSWFSRYPYPAVCCPLLCFASAARWPACLVSRLI